MDIICAFGLDFCQVGRYCHGLVGKLPHLADACLYADGGLAEHIVEIAAHHQAGSLQLLIAVGLDGNILDIAQPGRVCGGNDIAPQQNGKEQRNDLQPCIML